MTFDTLIKPSCPPKGETATSNEAPFGGLEPYDVDYRWLTPRAHEWMDKLDRKLIEHYGESFRRKVNHYRVEHGLKTL